jgi:hypothetical protein
MHDNVQWLVRSSQKDIESAAFSHLATKIGEEPNAYARNTDCISVCTITWEWVQCYMPYSVCGAN